jgi:hypothetical protein
MIRIHPFKERRKKIPTQCPMEGKREALFHLFPLSPQEILLKPSFFPLILRFYFTMVLGRYLRISLFFLDLQITTTHLDVTSPSHIHC